MFELAILVICLVGFLGALGSKELSQNFVYLTFLTVVCLLGFIVLLVRILS
jgi:amino acid transporter